MIRMPIVLMIRHPPLEVPNAIAAADEITTQKGTPAYSEMLPLATSASVITPIVFWASLVPWASASNPPDTVWPSRNPLVTGPGRIRPTILYAARIASAPTTNAAIGATTAGIRNCPTTPSASTAPVPTAATVAPTSPPIRAWEELAGRPKYHVIRFQNSAPISAAKTTVGVTSLASTISSATVAATWSEMNAPAKLRTAA